MYDVDDNCYFVKIFKLIICSFNREVQRSLLRVFVYDKN